MEDKERIKQAMYTIASGDESKMDDARKLVSEVITNKFNAAVAAMDANPVVSDETATDEK